MEIEFLINELKSNRAVILKCETVIGIVSINALTIYELKKRDYKKKLILFINNSDQIPNCPLSLNTLTKHFWPGKLTVIHHQQSYRSPNNLLLQTLIKEVGPLYSSSANISNQKEIFDFKRLQTLFKDVVCFDDQTQLTKIPSTIYDFDTKTVVRKGEIKENEITQYL